MARHKRKRPGREFSHPSTSIPSVANSTQANAGKCRGLALLLVVFSATILLMLAWPAFFREVYSYDDMATLCVPFRYLYAKALAAGESVLWTPQLCCGFYLHGDGQVGMFHPFHWLVYRTLPLDVAFNLEFLASYVVMFAGTYLMLTRRKLARPACLLGAMAFTFGGFSILHFMHIHAVAIAAHLPWLIVAIDVALNSASPRHRALAHLAVVLATASQILIGYPMYVVLSLVAEGAFVLWNITRIGWSRRLLSLASCYVFAFAIGAVQILPTWDALSQSQRAGVSLSYRTWFSMHPANLLQLVSPFAFRDRYFADVRIINGNTHEMGLYAGAFCTVAPLWLLIRWRRLQKDRWFVLAIFCFGLAMLWLALGSYGGVYSLLMQMPLLSSLPLRCPTRHALLVQLAMAVLAGYALDDMLTMLSRNECESWRSLWPLGILVLLSAATVVFVAWGGSHAEYHLSENLATWKQCLVGFVLISASVALVAAVARGQRWCVYGIIVLAFAEIALFGMSQYIWKIGDPRTLEAMTDLIPPPQAAPTSRLCFPDADHGNMLVMRGYRLMHGYVALIPMRQLPLDLLSLQLAGVSQIFFKDQWVNVPNSLPRARLVTQSLLDENAAAAVHRIDPATTAVVDRAVSLQSGTPGSCSIVRDEAGLVTVECHAATRQLLVLSEAYHSGWTAKRNGATVPVIRANGDYLGCVVDPGSTSVEFRFLPASFLRGATIAWIGIAATAIGFLAMLLFPALRMSA